MIKILHVITGLSTGGAEMMLFKLLSTGDKSRFDHEVVSLMDKGAIGRRIEALDTPIYALELSAGQISFTSIKRLNRIVKQTKPDVIQGWMYHGNFAATLMRLFSIRKVLILWNIRHSLYNIKLEKKNTSKIIRYSAILSNLPEYIIYNSRASANQHEQLGYMPDRTVVIPNGFDCEIFKPSSIKRRSMRANLGIGEKDILIGLFARYHPMKDHENFFEAAGIIAKKYEGVHFILAGSNVDDNNPKIKELILRNQLGGKVYLLGERHDIPAIMASVDIACSSSSYGEAFPNVIGEAMASAIPCVATDVGDSSWIIGDKKLVVPPRNARRLATALEYLIDIGQYERIKLGNEGRQRVIEKFTLNQITRQYESLYEKVCEINSEIKLMAR